MPIPTKADESFQKSYAFQRLLTTKRGPGADARTEQAAPMHKSPDVLALPYFGEWLLIFRSRRVLRLSLRLPLVIIIPSCWQNIMIYNFSFPPRSSKSLASLFTK